ncbi:MAG: YdcF family protein [Chloroflexi bacterium]|nr:YdcF family protein [Chloroflexota bacterium]
MRWLIKHRRTKGCLGSILLLGGIIALVVITHNVWLRWIGHFLVVSDPLQPVDAIVILGGGGRERSQQGAKLFAEDYARWYVVTNAPLEMPGIREEYSELMKREAIWEGVPEDRILAVPGLVKSTVAEAAAVRQLAEEQGFRSLIIVSDPYHMRRARLIFRDEFKDTGIRIIVRPAEQSRYDPDRWWKTSEGLNTTGNEYAKLLVFLLGYR